MNSNLIQKLIDAGAQITEMPRSRAEAAVKRLVQAGEVSRDDAAKTVQSLIERGKETTATISEAIQREMARQLGWLAERVDDLEDQLESMVDRMTAAAPAKKTAARKAPAKKAAAAKKAPARKTAARKAPAKKAAAATS